MAYVFNPFTGNLDTTDVVAFNGEVNVGTEGSPSLFFTGDPDTGIYSPGADQLAISTGGNGRLFVNANGNVGVGATASTDKLEIFGNIRLAGINNYIKFGNDLVTIKRLTNGMRFDSYNGYIFYDSLNTTERLRITSAGLVGIGTSSPARLLHLARSSGNPDIQLSGATSTTGVDIVLEDNSGIGFLTARESTGQWVFRTGGANERLRITSAGRLLVGTSTDSGGALLQVNGDRIRVATAKTPASATDTGTAGEICWDADYIYVCVATNSWKRTAIATW